MDTRRYPTRNNNILFTIRTTPRSQSLIESHRDPLCLVPVKLGPTCYRDPRSSPRHCKAGYAPHCETNINKCTQDDIRQAIPKNIFATCTQAVLNHRDPLLLVPVMLRPICYRTLAPSHLLQSRVRCVCVSIYIYVYIYIYMNIVHMIHISL